MGSIQLVTSDIVQAPAGETEEELQQNTKKHGIEVHGYTEETWNEEIAKNTEHFRKLIKST
jgi:hypothetical protein